MTEATVTAEAPPTFDALSLSPDVRRAIDALGYVNPTPVQLAVYEPAKTGRSLVVQARTGTGKTAAFGLPIVDALVKKSVPKVQALILTPTRELALQVGRELEQLGQFRGTKVTPIYGGAPMGKQIEALEGGAQIVSGTPGRVLDHLRRGTLDASEIKIFVLDEADEMLSMGFAKELNAIIEMLPKERQGLYFSATLPPDVERLAQSHLRDPEWVTLSSDSVGALEVSHFVYLVREGDKRAALGRIIDVEDPESAIVFCNTKDETERVAEMLKSKGYDADWLNGDLEQREREKVMQATRDGKVRFLVCTDVAARGIDISHLTHVINADFPESAEQYVHRTGRTGRAGRTGTAISVVGPKDVGHLYMLRLTYKIRPIERSLPTQGELRTRTETDLVAFLGDAYAGKKADPMHVSVARRLLTHGDAETIVAGLLADHLGQSQDPVAEAAESRRGKNPAPVAAVKAADEAVTRPREVPRQAQAQGAGGPTTLRDGQRPRDEGRRDRGERGERGGRDRDRDRGPRPAQPQAQPQAQAQQPRRDDGPRERRPHSQLASWEPPTDADDDSPIFSDGKSAPPATAQGFAAKKKRHDDDAFVDTDRHPKFGFTVEDAPTAAIRGDLPKPRREEASDDIGPDEIGEGMTNLFLNIGRRDGLGAAELQKMVADAAGVPASDTGRIRVRDRISFVAVKNEQAEAAIKGLVGQVVNGRTVSAEPARAGGGGGGGGGGERRPRFRGRR